MTVRMVICGLFIFTAVAGSTITCVNAQDGPVRNSLPYRNLFPKYSVVPTLNAEAALKKIYSGFDLIRRGNDAAALKTFEQARAKDPIGGYFYQQEALAHMRRYGESDYSLLRPCHQLERRRGSNSLDSKTDRQVEHQFVLGNYDACIALDPESYLFTRLRGLQKLHQGDLTGALADFKRTIKLASPQ